MTNPCKHENFFANVDVARMPKVEGGPIVNWMADVRVQCADCGLPFRFIGLPCGVDLKGACVSIDATEARLAIAPKDQVGTVLRGDDDVGFSVRRLS